LALRANAAWWQETNMDFDFSDDQQQLRDAVARWVDKGYTFERRQSIANKAASRARSGTSWPSWA
jgi:hypothetical protein